MASSTKRAWKLQEFVAHGASVNCLALGRKGGRVMVTGGEDRKVNLWAIGKQNCILTLTGNSTPVECVKFGPQEDMVCAGSMSGALKIWDLEVAKILRTLTGHKSNVRCIDFHPYGDFIASGSLDTNIKLWDIRRKGCIYTYKGHGKAVNSIRFSPDGRWIASGGEDGIVKLWDLPAGKMLTEFRGHTGPVTDIEFHPNEFLLATGSTDRTVKFWDLESFQIVSSTDGDSSPVRCIYFKQEGDCLFSAGQDVLKVYGWEPTRCFDNLSLGWGKVASMTMSQNQLIAGSFSLTTVSVYVVDLKRVQPFGSPTSSATSTFTTQPYTSNSTSSLRKNFSKTKPIEIPNVCFSSKRQSCSSKFTNELATSPEEENELSFPPSDNPAVFHPNRELTRTPPKDEPFPCPLDDVIQKSTFSPISPHEVKNPPKIPVTTRPTVTTRPVSLKLNSSPPKPMPPSSKSSTPSSPPGGQLPPPSQKIHNDPKPAFVIPTGPGVIPTKPPPSSAHVSSFNSKLPFVTSRREPVSAVVKPEPQKAIVLPEQKPVEFVPDQRDRPADLVLEEFLPRHLHPSVKLGGPNIPVMSETEVINTINTGHQSMSQVLQHRLKNLQIILAQWSTKDIKVGLDSAIHMGDPSVLVDILNAISLKPSIWNLDMCQTLLPAIYDILQSKYEAYMSVGCSALKLILKNFSEIIKENIRAPPGIGVDLTREERYHKCLSCYQHLLSIRAFLLKRQTLQGKLGQSFRELQILMQGLE